MEAEERQAEGVSTQNAPEVELTPQQQEVKDAMMPYQEQIAMLEEQKNRMEAPETEEQRKAREKKERSKRIIGAVSDGLRSLGNLFFTTQYAPNMYNQHRGSMLDAAQRQIDKAKAEREKAADQYYNFAMRIGDLKGNMARTKREIEAQQEARQMARDKAEREAEKHKWEAAIQPDKQREAKGKADKAGYDADYSRLKKENAPTEFENKNKLDAAKVDSEVARAGSYRASAANSYASAAKHNRSNVKEYRAWDKKGNMYTFKDKDAAEAFAKQEGTWKVTETTTQTDKTNTNERGKTTKVSQKTTKDSGYPTRPEEEEEGFDYMQVEEEEKNAPHTRRK